MAHRRQFVGAEGASGVISGVPKVSRGNFWGAEGAYGQQGCEIANILYNFLKSRNAAFMSIKMIQGVS